VDGVRDFLSDFIFSSTNVPARVYRVICITDEDAVHLYLLSVEASSERGHFAVILLPQCKLGKATLS